MLSRRHSLMMAPAAILAVPARAQRQPGLWFDPTQLPSYSGRLERWIATPSGSVDRGLFREGTQFIFPTSDAEAMMQSIEPGGPLCVWGIRARSAAVVLTLAWARTDADTPSFVERPVWFVADEDGRDPIEVSGRIQAPLLTPQGEGMGVLLTEGEAIHLSPGQHRQLGDALNIGERIAATGLGTRRGGLVALDAQRIGKDAASLQPVPTGARR